MPRRASTRTVRGARLLLTSLALVLVAACGNAGPGSVDPLPEDLPPPVEDPQVVVDDNVFEPREIVVTTGSTVTWQWEGRIVHDVAGDGFKSDIVNEGSFSHRFDAPGAYRYRCTLHAGMEGTVYVVATD